jgi:hypothetical protein
MQHEATGEATQDGFRVRRPQLQGCREFGHLVELHRNQLPLDRLRQDLLECARV